MRNIFGLKSHVGYFNLVKSGLLKTFLYCLNCALLGCSALISASITYAGKKNLLRFINKGQFFIMKTKIYEMERVLKLTSYITWNSSTKTQVFSVSKN